MSIRPLPRSRLDALVPSLVAEQSLVALVPATGDVKWAAGAAWDVARAAAAGGRRVALVDLWLEHPTLHEVVGLALADGIVDAFEYDVSLNKAAREVDHVFFISAGTLTTHASDLFANPRWRKLQGGFRVEGALLLVYLSAGALVRLSALPDGLIVLSPDGYEPESSIGQGITAALERGMPLLGVVRERWTPSPVAAAGLRSAAPPPGRISASVRGADRPRRRGAFAVSIVALATGAAVGWAFLARGAEQRPQRAQARARDTAARASATAPAPGPARGASPPPAPAPPPPRADSLAWTVQLAAYATLTKAFAVADRLSGDGVRPFVTPVAMQGRRRGTVWYRVLVGAYPTHDSAVGARAALWDHGFVTRGQGDVLRAPYSFVLTSALPESTLRARGIPAVPWGRGAPLLVGAFETPEQASLTNATLKRAGVPATLVTRMGTTP